MKYLKAAIAVVGIALILTGIASAGGHGYRASPALAPACDTCAVPPAQQFVAPQAQLNCVPRTVQFAETQYVPQTVIRQQTVFEPQLSYSVPQASFAPSYSTCAGAVARAPVFRSPGCYGSAAVGRSFGVYNRGFSGFAAGGFVGGAGPVAQTRGSFAQGNPGGEVVIRQGGLRGVFAGRVIRAR